jgi:hypothetical protein
MSNEYRTNYLLYLATPTPRRLTTYAGRTADGRRGLIYAGNYYQPAIVDWPKKEESDTSAPLVLEVTIGNAKNLFTDLFSDKANYSKPITIWKVKFTGTFMEAFAPTFTVEPYFEGTTARPSIQGEKLILECRASMGRRGKSPRTASRRVMANTVPPKNMSILLRP